MTLIYFLSYYFRSLWADLPIYLQGSRVEFIHNGRGVSRARLSWRAAKARIVLHT